MKWILVLGLVGALGCDAHGGGGNPGASGDAEPLGCEADPACVAPADGVYVIGSSYSQDAQPFALDDDPEWHIYCSRSLDYIFNFPTGHCVDSTPWSEVLEPPAQIYGYISFQPVQLPGSTQDLDISHISYWLAEQPLSTVGVIHTTWPYPANWEEVLHDPIPDHTFTNYSMDYFYDLLEKLELANPGRAFVLTRTNEMMDFIRHDPLAPIRFDELFRDASGHMSWTGGYLQHNAFRQAMGQETGVDNSPDGVPPDTRAYLDEVVELHPVR